MAFDPSNNPHDREVRFSRTQNIKSDFTLFPSYPLDNFLCQTSDPISSRLFSQPEPGSFPMDTMTPPENGPTENYKTFHHLPSPLCSIVRDQDATASPISDNLSYCGARFSPQAGQRTIQSNPSTSRIIGGMDPGQRIPYSPESLSSEYPYVSSGQDAIKAESAGQNISDSHPSGLYGINEPLASTSYPPVNFSQERDLASRHSTSGRLIPRNRFSRFTPYATPSASHSEILRRTSYEEELLQGTIAQRELPRSSYATDNGYEHIPSPQQGRNRNANQEVVPPNSSWPRPWPNTSSSDLHGSQPHPTPSYPSPYTNFNPPSSKVFIAPPYEPYGPEISQLPLRPREIETIGPSPLTNAIHCPHCTQKFPTTEQYTKHQQKHQKMYRCRFDNCTRTEGFATPNDRERHEKSVHKIPGYYWRCLDPNCSSYRKEFARRDNLKDHLKRMHTMPPGVDEAEANAWRSQMADNGKYEKPDTSTSGQHRRD